MSRLAPDRTSAAVLVAALVLSGAFACLAWRIDHRAPPEVDVAILRALRDSSGAPRGPGWAENAARDLTSLGSLSVLAVIAVIAAGGFAIARRVRSALTVLLSISGGVAVSELLKRAVGRPRPEIVPHLTRAFAESFPSGHALASAVAYLTLALLFARSTTRRALRLFFLCVAVALTVLIGLTRIYLGVHFPSDVLGGWMAGTAWVLFVAVPVRALPERGGGAPPSTGSG